MAYTTIDDPHKFFNIILWTGDGTGNRSLTGVGFQPDWVWTKLRSTAGSHQIYDIVRGATKDLESDNANAESTSNEDGFLNSFDSDGFTMNDGSSSDFYGNDTGKTYVAWNWLAGGSTSSNGDGSITSTVSVNSTSGFSIVSYTGTGSNATVGHGLGAAPSYIIIKDRDNSRSWIVGSDDIGWGNYMSLDATDASASLSSIWNSTAPTSTVFSVGTAANTNNSGSKLIAYCFKEIKGYSKFGKYNGNGNADGAFVYTGFRPAFILVKKSSGTKNWYLWDSTRASSNDGSDPQLYANLSNAEDSAAYFDILSNGFKNRNTGVGNDSGGTYIYMAFAEHPFVTEGTKAAGTAR